MNIYLISQNINNGYDTYDSAVVIAKDKKEARTINPSGFYTWSSELDTWMPVYSDGRREPIREDGVWVLPKDVKVTKIGVTKKDKTEVICASFNAG